MGDVTHICVVSTVGRISETPIQLWLETMLQAGYKVTVVMPQIDNQESQVANLQTISLPPVPYFWPNAYFIQTLNVVLKRAVNVVILFKHLLRLRPQICVCSEPDAWLLSVIVRFMIPMKVVLYLREVFEDRIQSFPISLNSILSVWLRKTMICLSVYTDEIVHVSSGRQDWYGYLRKRGIIIHHYPRLAQFSFSMDVTVKQRSSENIVLVHAGALRPTYGSDVLIDGFMQACQKCTNLRLLVLGGIAGRLRNQNLIDELVRKGILDLRSHVPHDQVLALLQVCDIGIVYVFENSITTRLAEPTKLFEYFASHLPVVASNVQTIRNIVQKWDCGLLFDPALPSSIADAILQLAEDQKMREKFSVNAARAARDELNWENEQPKLIELLESLSIKRDLSNIVI